MISKQISRTVGREARSGPDPLRGSIAPPTGVVVARVPRRQRGVTGTPNQQTTQSARCRRRWQGVGDVQPMETCDSTSPASVPLRWLWATLQELPQGICPSEVLFDPTDLAQRIARDYGLPDAPNEDSIQTGLEALERCGLIERLEPPRLRILVNGQPWRPLHLLKGEDAGAAVLGDDTGAKARAPQR